MTYNWHIHIFIWWNYVFSFGSWICSKLCNSFNIILTFPICKIITYIFTTPSGLILSGFFFTPEPAQVTLRRRGISGTHTTVSRHALLSRKFLLAFWIVWSVKTYFSYLLNLIKWYFNNCGQTRKLPVECHCMRLAINSV